VSWALRGGCADCGRILRIQYRKHPVSPTGALVCLRAKHIRMFVFGFDRAVDNVYFLAKYDRLGAVTSPLEQRHILL